LFSVNFIVVSEAIPRDVCEWR